MGLFLVKIRLYYCKLIIKNFFLYSEIFLDFIVLFFINNYKKNNAELSYNLQTCVDCVTHLILATYISQNPTDHL